MPDVQTTSLILPKRKRVPSPQWLRSNARKRYFAKRRFGICCVGGCHNPAKLGSSKCQKHFAKASRYMAKRRQKWAKAGKCQVCGATAVMGKNGPMSRCALHRALGLSYMHAKRGAPRSTGACQWKRGGEPCGREVGPRTLYCKECAPEAEIARDNARNPVCEPNGTCHGKRDGKPCGRRVGPRTVYCPECYKKRSKAKLRRGPIRDCACGRRIRPPRREDFCSVCEQERKRLALRHCACGNVIRKDRKSDICPTCERISQTAIPATHQAA